MSKSVNKVLLMGNVTRDPELRHTANGTAVCSFGLATNRIWLEKTGEKKEETEFHNIVAWNKLAETCQHYLSKGRKVFVEGRIATHSWTDQDGQQKSRTEIVIDNMTILDSKPTTATTGTSKPNRQKATPQEGTIPLNGKTEEKPQQDDLHS